MPKFVLTHVHVSARSIKKKDFIREVLQLFGKKADLVAHNLAIRFVSLSYRCEQTLRSASVPTRRRVRLSPLPPIPDRVLWILLLNTIPGEEAAIKEFTGALALPNCLVGRSVWLSPTVAMSCNR